MTARVRRPAGGRARHHAGRTLGAAVLALLMAAACGASAASPGASAPASVPSGPAPAAIDAMDVVNEQVGPNGEISLEVALQAFAVAFGPLPGVTAPAGPADVDSGTTIVAHLARYWDELSAEQQATARKLVGHKDFFPPATSGLHVRGAGVLAGPLDGITLDVEAEPVATDHPRVPEYQAVADLAVEEIASALGSSLSAGSHPVVMFTTSAYEGFPQAKASATLAPGEPCRIVVYPLGHELVPIDVEWLMAHEAFHCFQHDLLTRERAGQVADWIIEGGASWVGLKVIQPERAPISDKHWLAWLSFAPKPLFARAYDALGWYAHLEDIRGTASVWGLLTPQLLEAVGTNGPAYSRGVELGGDDFLDTWGPGYQRAGALLGEDWDFGGTGIPVSAPVFENLNITNGSERPIDVPKYAVAIGRADVSADVVTIGSAGLHGRVAFPGGGQKALAEVQDVGLCTLPGGCACPAGSRGADKVTLAIQPGDMRIAPTGHTTGGRVTIRGVSLDDWCGGTTCHLGRWELDNDTFVPLQALAPAPGATGNETPLGTYGFAQLFFREDGYWQHFFNTFTSHYNGPQGPGGVPFIRLETTGTASGTSTTEAIAGDDARIRLVLAVERSSIATDHTTFLGRNPDGTRRRVASSTPPVIPLGALSGAVTIACGDDTLVVDVPTAGGVVQVTYLRNES